MDILNNKYIEISQTFVDKYNLPSNLVKMSHLQELVETQKDLDFMLAPKLCEEYLNTNNHFLKMRVGSASNLLSYDVSSALNFLAEEKTMLI